MKLRGWICSAVFAIAISSCSSVKTSVGDRGPPARPDIHENLFFAAKKKVEVERYGEAKALLESYLHKSPTGNYVDQSLLFLGQLALRDKKFDLADKYFNNVIAKAPPSPIANLARYYRARNWDAQGKKLEALADLAQINDREGAFPEIEKLKMFLFWGRLAHEFKQPRDAALAYRRAYHISEDLNNATALVEARTQLQFIIQNELSVNDLETFMKVADANSVPGQIAQKRYDDLKAAGALPNPNGANPAAGTTALPVVNLSQVAETYGEQNKLGVLLPIENVDKPWGRAIFEGIQLAIKRSNSQLQLITADPGATVDTARVAIEHLVKDQKVMAVVGPLTGDQAFAAAKRAEALGVPFISTSPRTQPDWGATTINFSFGFEKQSEALVKFAAEFLNATRYAMIFPRDEFGKEFAESFAKSVARHGGKFTAIESYPAEQKDFRKNIENMVGLGNLTSARWAERDQLLKEYQAKVNRPLRDKERRGITLPPIVDFDVVFIPDSYKVIGQVAPLFAYFDINGITLMGPSTWNSPQVLKRAGQFLEESVFVDFFSKSSPNEVTREFMKNFEVEFGKTPGSLHALGFDLGSSIDRAMRGASSNRKDLMGKFLGLGEFVGVLGLERWDASRDPIAELQIFRIRKSNIQWQQAVRIR